MSPVSFRFNCYETSAFVRGRLRVLRGREAMSAGLWSVPGPGPAGLEGPVPRSAPPCCSPGLPRRPLPGTVFSHPRPFVAGTPLASPCRALRRVPSPARGTPAEAQRSGTAAFPAGRAEDLQLAARTRLQRASLPLPLALPPPFPHLAVIINLNFGKLGRSCAASEKAHGFKKRPSTLP